MEAPLSEFFLHLILIPELGIFIALLTSLLTPFFSDSVPVKNVLLLRISLSSLVIQGLLFGKIVTSLVGMMLSTKKVMCEDTCSMMLLAEGRKLFQSVDSILAELQCSRGSTA